jgi:hypothetical protein
MKMFGCRSTHSTAAYFPDMLVAKREIENQLREYPNLRIGYACSFLDAHKVLMHVLAERHWTSAIDAILDLYLGSEGDQSSTAQAESQGKALNEDDVDSIWSVIIFPEEHT